MQTSKISNQITYARHDYHYNSILTSIKMIIANEGYKGLFKGAIPSLVKAPITSAILFTVNESCRKFVCWINTKTFKD